MDGAPQGVGDRSWDGTKWLRWNGQIWIDEPNGKPVGREVVLVAAIATRSHAVAPFNQRRMMLSWLRRVGWRGIAIIATVAATGLLVEVGVVGNAYSSTTTATTSISASTTTTSISASTTTTSSASSGPVAATSVSALLKQNLWSDRDAYDATFALMVPLHTAFGTPNNNELANYFSAFFARFLAHPPSPAWTTTLLSERLNRLQFTYLVSRYGVLQSSKDGCTSTTRQVRAWLDPELTRFLASPAWQWDAPSFPNVPARIRWRLSSAAKTSKYKYQGALTDEDTFSMAISADLQTIDLACKYPTALIVRQTVALAYKAFTEKVVKTSSGGWLFQPGVFSDHPEYIYAGNLILAPGLKPKPIANISDDSSHDTRLPLFLVSLRCNAEMLNHKAEAERYLSLENGLETQLIDVVAKPTSLGIMMTNYMDGRNGVYRYDYTTVGANLGYGPYQLSGTFNLGWWSFAGTKAQSLYLQQINDLPFSAATLVTYIGPGTTRVQNPAFVQKYFFTSPLQTEILDDAANIGQATICGANW